MGLVQFDYGETTLTRVIVGNLVWYLGLLSITWFVGWLMNGDPVPTSAFLYILYTIFFVIAVVGDIWKVMRARKQKA